MKLARKGIIWLAALFALLLGGLTVLADDLDGSSGMDVDRHGYQRIHAEFQRRRR